MGQLSTILVTGGAGYIGSHLCVCLIEAGYDVVVLDNHSNSFPIVMERVETIAGRKPTHIQGDVRDKAVLEKIFARHDIKAIVHMAGLKAVGESVTKPLVYYANNVEGARVTLETALEHGVHNMLFSSSATVYGTPHYLPLDEKHPLQTTNPYGETKRVVDEMLSAVSRAVPVFNAGILRYFNPIGAHSSGLIGEDPRDTPNNLLPYVAQVAIGRREYVSVYGNDYDTPDGTGVRDYIHVMDLARAHVSALSYMLRAEETFTVNLGTGRGYSVLDVIEVFKTVSGQDIPYRTAPRRAGDVASCYTDASVAERLLGWRAQHDLTRMCEDHWRWQSRNPQGYVP